MWMWLGFIRGNTLIPHNIAYPTHRFSLCTYSTICVTRSLLLTHVRRSTRPGVRTPTCLIPNGIELRRCSKANHLGYGDTVPVPCTHGPSVYTCMCVRAQMWRGGCNAASPATLSPLFPNLPNRAAPPSHTHTLLSSSSHASLAVTCPCMASLRLSASLSAAFGAGDVSSIPALRSSCNVCSVSVFVPLFRVRRHFSSSCSVVIGFAHWVVLILIAI